MAPTKPPSTPTEAAEEPKKRKAKREHGDKGRYATVEYDPVMLLETWRALGKKPSVERLHAQLVKKGLDVSLSWARNKVHKHNIVALGGMAILGNDAQLLNVKSVRMFLETVGKDMDPHDMLRGLQTRTLVSLSMQLDQKDHNVERLQGMMKFYGQLTDELTSTYQKRIAAGEHLPLPQKKVEEKEEVVTPFKRKGA